MSVLKTIKRIVYRLRGEVTTEELIQRGLTVGNNLKRLNQVIIDDSHAWLISIGDNVTLAPRVHLLAHDASTKVYLGYTKIGRVTIGDNVFIGAGTVVLPGVTIGKNTIVGANSTVTHDIPEGVVVAGNPAQVLYSLDEYLTKEKIRMGCAPRYGIEFTMPGGISLEQKQQQRKDLVDGIIGYVE